MLSKSPPTTSATTFAFSGAHTVRLACVACPYCGRFLHASDVEVVPGGITIICAGSGCHNDVLTITEATSTEATP
jgi:hypothetical protein